MTDLRVVDPKVNDLAERVQRIRALESLIEDFQDLSISIETKVLAAEEKIENHMAAIRKVTGCDCLGLRIKCEGHTK